MTLALSITALTIGVIQIVKYNQVKNTFPSYNCVYSTYTSSEQTTIYYYSCQINNTVLKIMPSFDSPPLPLNSQITLYDDCSHDYYVKSDPDCTKNYKQNILACFIIGGIFTLVVLMYLICELIYYLHPFFKASTEQQFVTNPIVTSYESSVV